MKNKLKNIYFYILQRRSPVLFSKKLGVKVGENCRFLSVSSSTFGTEPYLISIGDHVTITAGVRFITHDGGVWVLREKYPNADIFKQIKIGNNVFIGLNAIIMPGVSVGDNSIIAAGAIVTKSFPEGSVIGGNPARYIKSYNDYVTKIEDSLFFTKGLSYKQKKEILENHFKIYTS